MPRAEKFTNLPCAPCKNVLPHCASEMSPGGGGGGWGQGGQRLRTIGKITYC